jgi:chromosome segregation ATPase
MLAQSDFVKSPSPPWQRPWWRGKWSAIMQAEKGMTWGERLQAASNAVVLVTALAVAVKLATGGGFVLQQQVQTQQQQEQTQQLQVQTQQLQGQTQQLQGQVQQFQGQISQLSDKVGDLSSQIKAFSDKVQELPRPTDYTAINAILARHDQQFRDMDARVGQDEVNIGKLQMGVQRLHDGTETPVRQPR